VVLLIFMWVVNFTADAMTSTQCPRPCLMVQLLRSSQGDRRREEIRPVEYLHRCTKCLLCCVVFLNTSGGTCHSWHELLASRSLRTTWRPALHVSIERFCGMRTKMSRVCCQWILVCCVWSRPVAVWSIIVRALPVRTIPYNIAQTRRS